MQMTKLKILRNISSKAGANGNSARVKSLGKTIAIFCSSLNYYSINVSIKVTAIIRTKKISSIMFISRLKANRSNQR